MKAITARTVRSDFFQLLRRSIQKAKTPAMAKQGRQNARDPFLIWSLVNRVPRAIRSGTIKKDFRIARGVVASG